MKRGPIGKSGAAQALEGNPGNRPLRRAAPQPAPAPQRMPPPRHLSPLAQARWKAIYGPLREAGLLTIAEIALLEVHCECYARWRRAEEQLQATGDFTKTSNGATVLNPLHRLARQAGAEVVATMRELAMTRPARERLESAGTGGDPMAALSNEEDWNREQAQFGGFAGLIGKAPR